MYDALVLTLGFEPGPLIRALASTPLNPEARVLVLLPQFKDERSERAFLDFKRISSMMLKEESRGELKVGIEKYEVPLKPLSLGIQAIRSLFKDLINKEVVIALTGSMRALVIATYIAYLTTQWVKEPKVLIYLEGRGESVEIPPIRQVLELTVTDIKQKILNALTKPKTVGELAIELDKDRSVIYRHLQWLEAHKLILRRGKYIELTELGKSLALPK